MPRKNLIRTNIFPYHVTARTHNKEAFEIPINMVWWLAQQSLKEANDEFPVELISFVLMKNHYHMILKTPGENLDLFMREFNRRLAVRIRRRGEKINQVFGSRYHWCVISSNQYFMNCYRYVYQNPVRAGASKRCENYPFSTLVSLVNETPFSIQIYDSFGFKDKWGLKWLNESLSERESESIKHSLKKRQLTTLVDPNTRKPLAS